MPNPIVAPTIVRFSMHATYVSGHRADNIVDVSLDEFGQSRVSALGPFVQAVVGLWQDNFLSHLNDHYTFTGCTFLDLDSEDGTGGFHGPVGGKPTQGGDGNNGCSPAVAYLIHKNCNPTRRQKNGRMYLVGALEAKVGVDGAVDSGAISDQNNAANGFKSGIENISTSLGFGTTAWRVVHIKGRDGAGDVNQWSSSDIVSVNCDPFVATQRRRQR